MTKRVYLYPLTGERPMALIDAPLVDGPFPSSLQGHPQPVIEWNGCIFYWQEQISAYRQWTLTKNLATINKSNVVAAFGASTG